MRIILFLLSIIFSFPLFISASSPQLVTLKKIVYIDAEPELLYQPSINFPESYKSHIISANIWMSLLVNNEGKVIEANIEFPCTDSILNDIALNSVFEYSFKPAIQGGQPISYWVWCKMNFTSKTINKILTYKVTLDFDDYYPTLGECFTPLDVLPELIHQVIPKYPRLAKAAGIQGRVWIKALVNIKGDVVKAEVAKTSGTVALDDAALIVAKENKFKPAKQNGKIVAAWILYLEEFKVDN